MPTARTLVTVRGILGEDAAVLHGMVLWVISPTLREMMLSGRPQALHSSGKGTVGRLLRKAEFLALSRDRKSVV